jgi:hypothetical protein
MDIIIELKRIEYLVQSGIGTDRREAYELSGK